MTNIKGEKVVFENGAALDAYIKGLVKNIEESRTPPTSHLSCNLGLTNFTETPQQINISDRIRALAKSNVMTVDNNIVKLFNPHYMFGCIAINGLIQFNTVNNTGAEVETYLQWRPRYYTDEDELFENPVNWGTHAIHMSMKIPTGTRRWLFPISDYFSSIGKGVTGIDFTIFVAGDHENLTYTFTRRSVLNIDAMSSQYE